MDNRRLLPIGVMNSIDCKMVVNDVEEYIWTFS